MTKLDAFALGVVIGYVAHAFRVGRDPRGFMDRLRAQLQREEGVAAQAAASAEGWLGSVLAPMKVSFPPLK